MKYTYFIYKKKNKEAKQIEKIKYFSINLKINIALSFNIIIYYYINVIDF